MDWENTFRKLRKEDKDSSSPFPWHDLEVVEKAVEAPLAAQQADRSEENQPKKSEKSEKETVLKGLKDLAEEKEKESGTGIKFPGGEVKLAESPLESSEKIQFDALENAPSLKVLFVYNYSSDALEMPEESRAQAPSEQLLSRMIKAMKMGDDEFEKLVIEEGSRDLLLKKLSETKVEIVVPMGAIATNLVLGKQERISKVHGKFFTKELAYKNDQVRSFQVVPVFNPEMILINPNMKRSTWMDLQKIMEKLGIALD